MLNVSPVELLVICTVGLIVLGPQKLPEVARQIGRVTSELRRMANGFQTEMRDAMDLEAMSNPTPARPGAASPQARPPLATPAPEPPVDTPSATVAGADDAADPVLPAPPIADEATPATPPPAPDEPGT